MKSNMWTLEERKVRKVRAKTLTVIFLYLSWEKRQNPSSLKISFYFSKIFLQVVQFCYSVKFFHYFWLYSRPKIDMNLLFHLMTTGIWKIQTNTLAVLSVKSMKKYHTDFFSDLLRTWSSICLSIYLFQVISGNGPWS